jgi:integrase
MPGKQAKVVTPPMLKRMLRHVSRSSSHPTRDRTMILLSIKAGLRACEIAGLD